jgi:peptide/nickel transport system permease protein
MATTPIRTPGAPLLLDPVDADRPRQTLLRSALRSPAVWSLVILVLLAVLASVIAPYGETEITEAGKNAEPSASHLFGTDSNGMDVFSRVLFGARKDLLLALAAAALAAVVGVFFGAVAGYAGGWTNAILQRIAEILQSFPTVLLAMAALVALGVTLTNLTLVIALVNVPVYYWIVRSVVRPMRHAEFVEAARCTGSSPVRIVVRHLLPNVTGPVIAQFTVNFAWAIQIIAGLSFLGLGVHVPEAEWGLMIQQGSGDLIRGIWWPSFFPGAAIFIAVLTLNRLGAWLHRMERR